MQLVPTVELKMLIKRRGKLHKQPRTNIAYSRFMKKILITKEWAYYIAIKYLAPYWLKLPIWFRCRLKIDVTVEDQFLSITMFNAAKYYFGCNVKEYVLPTFEKVNHLLYELLASINNFTLFQL